MQHDDPGKALELKIPPILKNKLFLTIAGSILFLAVAGGVYGIFALRDFKTDEPLISEAGENGSAAEDQELTETAEVLPQQRRDSDTDSDNGDNEAWTMFDSSTDPFADPMRLTGTVTGGRSGTMAIIESSGTSYIVSEYDYVDDLWAVREVSADKVILRAHNKEIILYLDQPPVTRSLDPGNDGDDQGEDE